MFKHRLSFKELVHIMITHDIIKIRILLITAHAAEVEEALISFRMRRNLCRRQHGVKLHCK